MRTSARACPTIREIPGRFEAERALAAALKGGRRSFCRALLFLPERVAEALEARDWETADHLLLSACERIGAFASPGVQLFRWTAGSLLVIFDGDPPLSPDGGSCRLFLLSPALDTPRLFRTLDAWAALGASHP
jgi:hypothetical protein